MNIKLAVIGNIFELVMDSQSETHRRLVLVFFQTCTVHTWIRTYTLRNHYSSLSIVRVPTLYRD